MKKTPVVLIVLGLAAVVAAVSCHRNDNSFELMDANTNKAVFGHCSNARGDLERQVFEERESDLVGRSLKASAVPGMWSAEIGRGGDLGYQYEIFVPRERNIALKFHVVCGLDYFSERRAPCTLAGETDSGVFEALFDLSTLDAAIDLASQARRQCDQAGE